MNIHRKNVFEHNVCTLYYIIIIVGSMQRRIMQGELQNETAIQQINARLLKSQIVCFSRGGGEHGGGNVPTLFLFYII